MSATLEFYVLLRTNRDVTISLGTVAFSYNTDVPPFRILRTLPGRIQPVNTLGICVAQATEECCTPLWY